MEIFKSIIDFEGLYEVSNLGRVKSLERYKKHPKNGFSLIKERILKQNIGNHGYYYVDLWKNNIGKKKTVHQLVAESFLNHISNGYKLVVNHIDFNKLNNNLLNLEIITNRENTNQKHIKSSSKYVGVNWHKINNKWRASIIINAKYNHLGYFNTEIEAHNSYQNKLKEIN